MRTLVDYWSEVAPRREAVRCGPVARTWAQLAERVDRNAAGQHASGLRTGDRVAFLDKNGTALLETMMACLRVGTVMTPVNHLLSVDDLRYVLHDAGPRTLFVGSEFLPLLDTVRASLPANARVIVIGGPDDTYEHWLRQNNDASGRRPEGESGRIAARVYTGGTTGRPRGVLLTEDALTAQALAVNSVVGVGPYSTGMVALPMFHVAALTWALTVMYHGGRTVIVRDVEPLALLDQLVRQKVTHVPLVPPLYDALLRVPGAAERDYSHLEALVYGASPMPLPLLRRVLTTFGAPVLQGYGMTETASVITMLGAAEHRDPDNRHRLASVGKPLPGVEIEIVDPVTGAPLDTRRTGEIRVRTRQLMAGYANGAKADTTAIGPDGRLRTGDAGYLDHDGYLYLVDRIEDMYLSEGQYVSPAEVEKVIIEHPAVAEVAVVGMAQDNGETSGTAFIVPAAGADVDPDELRDHCLRHLDAFQCPVSFEAVPRLPRSAAGKILKHLLRTSAVTRRTAAPWQSQ